MKKLQSSLIEFTLWVLALLFLVLELRLLLSDHVWRSMLGQSIVAECGFSSIMRTIMTGIISVPMAVISGLRLKHHHWQSQYFVSFTNMAYLRIWIIFIVATIGVLISTHAFLRLVN